MGHSPGKRPILEPNLKARRGPVPNTSPLGMGASLMSRPHHHMRRAPFMRVMDNSVAQSPPDHLRFAAHLDKTNGTPDRSRRSVFCPDGIQTPRGAWSTRGSAFGPAHGEIVAAGSATLPPPD